MVGVVAGEAQNTLQPAERTLPHTCCSKSGNGKVLRGRPKVPSPIVSADVCTPFCCCSIIVVCL